jgi:hypothetical protein
MVAVAHSAPEASAPQAVAAWLATLARRLLRRTWPVVLALDHARALRQLRGRDGEPLIARLARNDPGRVEARRRYCARSIARRISARTLWTRKRSARALAPTLRRSYPERHGWMICASRCKATPTSGCAAERPRKMLPRWSRTSVVLIKLAERTAALRPDAGDGDGRAPPAGSAKRSILRARQPPRGLEAQVSSRISPACRSPKRTRRSRSSSTSAGLDRERYIEIVLRLHRELAAVAPCGDHGPSKHIYSIWNSAGSSRVSTRSTTPRGADSVDDVKDCYAALGIVHHIRRRCRASLTTTSRSLRRITTVAAHGGDRTRTSRSK